jgi:hypothetical protein
MKGNYVYCPLNDQSFGCDLLLKLIHNKKKRTNSILVDNCILLHTHISPLEGNVVAITQDYFTRYRCEREDKSLICIVQTWTIDVCTYQGNNGVSGKISFLLSFEWITYSRWLEKKTIYKFD